MQTPQGVLCRALIMLSAVLALPYLAVFGLEVPQGLIDLVPKDWIPPALQSGTSGPVETATPPVQYRIETPGAPLLARPATEPAAAQVANPAREFASRGRVDAVTPARFESTPPEFTPAMPPAEVASPAPSTHGPAALEARLAELGAIDTELAPWGQNLYRFQGRFAIGQQGGLSRYFSAIDTDPERAMQKVLADVAAWRNARR